MTERAAISRYVMYHAATMLNRLRTSFWRRPADEPAAPVRAPDGLTLYAVGDIHGEADLLDGMLAAIGDDFAAHGGGSAPVLVYVGDYIDRGPNSSGVIDRLISGPLPGFRQHCLMGNHEAAMLDFLREPASGAAWLDFGGMATLHSYGVAPPRVGLSTERLETLRDALAERLPSEHLAFLRRLELSVVYGDYAFVHAGIRPGRPLAEQEADDLLWIRSPFLEATKRHEKTIVHGHTISADIEILSNRIGIDTGAYYSGCLSAVVLNGDTVRRLQVDRNKR
jgi:serine/threonine protein phosphatase 1